MSYENATATKMMATRCANCGRPLLDADSVNSGLGPECRRKLMVMVDGGENRDEANRLIYAVAMDQNNTNITRDSINALVDLGYINVAMALGKRFAGVCIWTHGEYLYIKTGFNPEYNAAIKRIRGRFNPEAIKEAGIPAKCWSVHKSQKGNLWNILCDVMSGTIGIGPKGMFSCRPGGADDDGGQVALPR